MMLVISSNDMRRLSPTCRAELMSVLMSSEQVDTNIEDLPEPGYFDEPMEQENVVAAADEAIGQQRKVNLTVDEAQELLAKLNKSAWKTLESFASGKRIPKSSLVGAGCDYANDKDFGLKLVGAVKRRLRNLTGIRNATLFLSDRDNNIYVSKKTAHSLRVVFGMPTPVPDFEFISRDGTGIKDLGAAPCKELQERLVSTWGGLGLAVRPSDVSRASWAESTCIHFAKSGLHLYVGKVRGWDESTESEIFAFEPVADPMVVIQEAFKTGPASIEEIFFGLDGDAPVMARMDYSDLS